MNIRTLTASSFGNILEWFDFGLFIYLAPIIGTQFFPTHDVNSATLAAFGVFAAGFVCRPLGGILFGHWGDKRGRVRALRWSILGISFATLVVGFLPTYHTIGILASILFTLLRLVQGLAVGGEYGGVMIYLAESSPRGRRGFFTSFGASSANGGFLLATLTTILLKTTVSSDVIYAWAWRIPFIGAGVIGLFVLYYRLKLLETAHYLYLKTTQRLQKKPLLTAMRYAPTRLLRIVGLTCMGSTLYFVFFGYMPMYLSQYTQVSLPEALSFQAIVLVVMMVLIPIAGACGDKIGRKKMLLLAALSIICLTLPCFYLLQHNTWIFVMLALGIVTIISAMEQGNTLTMAVEHLPTNIRYSGVCFSYNVGNALFGGTAPLVVDLLVTRMGVMAPAYYLIIMGCISFLAIVTLGEKPPVSLLALPNTLSLPSQDVKYTL